MDTLNMGWRTALLLSLAAPTLVAAVIIGIRAADRPAFMWLAALLGAWCWHSIPYIIGFAGAYDAFPWLTFAPFNMELWFGPMLYLHARALARNEPPARLWLWLLPGAVQFSYYTVCFTLLGDSGSKFAFNNAFHEPYIVPVESAIGIGLAILGMTLTWREITAYQRWLGRSHSAADAFDPVWLRRFVAGMALSIGAWIGFDIWGALAGGLSYFTVFWMYAAIGAVFLLLALDGLTHVNVVFPKVAAMEPLPDQRSRTPLSASDVAKEIRKARLHRDPNLTLSSLSRRIGTNETYLSRAINTGAGVNFNRFINEIRVEEVCDRLLNSNDEQTLLEIAMGAGFASKATFNRVFRDIKGETPRRWRQTARQSLRT
ncbi:MAG: AraC family transcriptional regulator [Pseudomonadota bacterium]